MPLNRTTLEDGLKSFSIDGKEYPIGKSPLSILALVKNSPDSNNAIEGAKDLAESKIQPKDTSKIEFTFTDGTYSKCTGKGIKAYAKYILEVVQPAKMNLEKLSVTAPKLDSNHKRIRETSAKESDYSIFEM